MRNCTLILYNEFGETVFSSNDYTEVAKFLGKNMDNTYQAISRVRHNEIKHLYDSDGNKYVAEIIEHYPEKVQKVIDSAIEIIYDRGTLDENSEYGQVFRDLLKLLEGGMQLEGDDGDAIQS